MLGYLAIFGAALAGYGGMPPYVIAVAAIALASLSYAAHGHLYGQAQELGLLRVVNSVLLRSFANGLLAAGVAYGGGWILRLV